MSTRYDPLEEFDKRYDPAKPPIMYELDNHGYIKFEDWKGLDVFLSDHPLPKEVYWTWRCIEPSQIRLHRSDDPEYMDRYGLENIQSSAIFGLQRIE